MRSYSHRAPGHGPRFRSSVPVALPASRHFVQVALALALGAGAVGGAAAQGVDWTLTGGEAKKGDVKKLGVIAGWTRAEPL